MSSTTAVISGLARDVAGILPLTMARIEQIGAMFDDYRAVIYENDSRDETARLLTDWAKRNPKVNVTIERRGDLTRTCNLFVCNYRRAALNERKFVRVVSKPEK